MPAPPLPLDPADLAPLLASAGRLAMAGFRHGTPSFKADGSIVTDTDRAVEAFLREGLARLTPGIDVLGEEAPPGTATPDPYLWAVDPIDGTHGFASGFAYFAIAVGLMHGGVPVLGAVLLPALGPGGDYFLGGAGVPATRNGARIAVLAPGALVVPGLFVPSDVHRRPGLRFPGKVRCAAASATHLVLVADGSGLGAVVTQASLWDVAGPLAILAAAGGAWAHPDGSGVDLAALRDGGALQRPLIAAPAWALAGLSSTLGDVESRVDFL